jgi:hypothetical protein
VALLGAVWMIGQMLGGMVGLVSGLSSVAPATPQRCRPCLPDAIQAYGRVNPPGPSSGPLSGPAYCAGHAQHRQSNMPRPNL